MVTTNKTQRVKELQNRVNILEKEAEVNKLKQQVRSLKNPRLIQKKDKNIIKSIKEIPQQVDISRISKISSPRMPNTFVGSRAPVDRSESMWVESMWENRAKLDPNFDPDNWFHSSVHLKKDRMQQIDNFWTGKSVEATKNKNAEDFWMQKTHLGPN